MRHNIWKKYLKIVCSCILILSICCLSLNVVEASDAIVKMESDSQETEDFISDIENQETEPEILADDEQLSESEQILEPENDPEHPAETEDSADQITDMDAPEQISVQSLEEELLAVAENGEEASTDRVEYVDVNGNPIAGAPSVIKFGAIADHKELSIEGRHFEFKSAKVNGKNCVYIGKYNDTIYYSTDGVIAIKLEEAQKLTMMYQEYYLVSIEEVVPDNCTPGTITQKNGSLDVPLDISNSIRVNAGENFMISVTPGTDTSKANDPRAKRFKIASVVSQNGATITQENGDEYKATYSINVVKDDKITITYEEQSVYRITINTKDINGEEYINIAHSVAKGWQYLEGQDKIMWTFTPDKVSEMSGYELDIPAFHTNRGYRVINMVVNGASIQSTSGSGGREVPINKGDTVSSAPRNLDLTTEMTNSYTSKKDDEKDCSYEYTISLKVRTGKFEDYNFTLVPYKEEHGRQAVTVRLLTDGSRNGEGLDVVMWDYEKQALVPIKDNQTVDMDPVTYEGSKKTRQVRIFFAKPKAGYTYDAGQAGQITGVSYGRPHGADQTLDGRKSDANAGNINDMTATSLKSGKTSYIIYDNQWQAAKEAAIKGGYTRYIAWGGAKPLDLDNDWYLYDATFMVVSSGIYVHYNSGAGMGVLPNNADVKNIPDNPETRSNNKTPMHSYGKNLETRAIGTTFIMGEGWAEPTCEGYEFIGWKLKNKDGKLSQETYSNGELFTISDENYGYANNTDLPVFASNNFTGYQIVAQWKKTAKKEVKVEHYLKIPDGKEKLEKTTSGTISFSADGESVKAFANPEPDGTFPGYVFDESDKQNTLVMDVTNNASSEPVILRLYYKPTVLHVSKTVEGYNQEPNKEFTFTLTATPPAGADQGTSQIKDGQIYITKGSKAKAIPLSFANNQATFTLKKDESVKINCLPTGWSYKVSEEDPGKNYKTTYKINNGSATDGRDVSYEMDKETDIAFINKSTMEPPVTGRTLANNGLMVLMFFVLAISMVGMVFFKRINKKN